MFSKFTPNLHWTMLQTPVHFHLQLVTFVATRGPYSFLLLSSLQGRVLNPSSSYSHQIFIRPRSKLQSIYHSFTVIFVVTRRPTSFSLVHATNPSVCNGSFSNSYHTFLGPRLRCQSVFCILQFHFWPQRGQLHFSSLCSTALSFQWIVFKFTPNVH